MYTFRIKDGVMVYRDEYVIQLVVTKPSLFGLLDVAEFRFAKHNLHVVIYAPLGGSKCLHLSYWDPKMHDKFRVAMVKHIKRFKWMHLTTKSFLVYQAEAWGIITTLAFMLIVLVVHFYQLASVIWEYYAH